MQRSETCLLCLSAPLRQQSSFPGLAARKLLSYHNLAALSSGAEERINPRYPF